MNLKKRVYSPLFAGLFSLAGMTLTPAGLQADTLAYAINSGAGFGTVDLNTGIYTQTSTPNQFNSGLGVYNGNLYGVTGPGNLYQINPSSGGVAALPTTNTNFNVDGFGSTTAGLFGVVAGNPANLYSFDPVTGAPTLIGSTGIQGLAGSGALSVSNDSSTLYWAVETSVNSSASSLYSINTSTGAATLIGTTNGLGPTPVAALLLEGGTLWGEFVNNNTTGPTVDTFNTTTGAATLVSIEESANGAHQNLAGLAPDPLSPTVPPPPASTPEPTTLALGGVSLGAIGLLRRFTANNTCL